MGQSTLFKNYPSQGIPSDNLREATYFKKLPTYTDAPGESTEPFGWFCNMTVVRLRDPEGGCLLYSPIMDREESLAKIVDQLEALSLLPVREVMQSWA